MKDFVGAPLETVGDGGDGCEPPHVVLPVVFLSSTAVDCVGYATGWQAGGSGHHTEVPGRLYAYATPTERVETTVSG